jgi:hypothetical protein
MAKYLENGDPEIKRSAGRGPISLVGHGWLEVPVNVLPDGLAETQ